MRKPRRMKNEGLTGQDGDRPPTPAQPGWRERARFRRRLRYLRNVRELARRDLGGLIFDMYRFGSKRQDLVQEKLDLMFAADNELYTLETALDEHQRMHELRIPGVRGSCPECGTLNSTDARFCSNCAEPLRTTLRPGQEQAAPVAQPEPAPVPPIHEPFAAPHDEVTAMSAEDLHAQEDEEFGDEGYGDEEFDAVEYEHDEELYADEEVDEHQITADHDAGQPTVLMNGPVDPDAIPPGAISPNGAHAEDEEAPHPLSAGDPLGSDELDEAPNGSHLAAGDPLAAPREEPHR
ncbi:MAG: hypothetical protein QOK04_1869 [Solirubrobacteraceae bacterium]|nr:hypothetical protein [Solirubrobacteraceae bacterium]